MIRLRISPDGTVRALWSDELDWRALGSISVRRASHVEFCDRRQQWYVWVAKPEGWIRRRLQWWLGRPFGEILFWAGTRSDALAWERENHAPGRPRWRQGSD